MRTKSIILGAALLAAGALSSLAQSNVYSLNVVGYYTLPMTNGFQIISKQLDFDGTGTNNTVVTTFGTNLPNLTKVIVYNAATITFANASYLSGSGTWTGNTNAVNAALNTGGSGMFVQIPAAAAGIQPLTIAGTVQQGALTTPLAIGFNLLSSQTPISGGVRTTLNLQPANLDFIFQFNPATQTYGGKHSFLSGSGTWTGGEPNVAVGEGFWFSSTTSTNSWNTNFTVQ